MDFMLYAMDAIVNQAAKWSHMFGGQAHPSLTIRGIINRGGEQGAQHSQALHSWFAHIPGLRVVMPATVADARDLLIASVLCKDPVIYIDDRWLYSQTDELREIQELDLRSVGPQCLYAGTDISIVASGYSTLLALEAKNKLTTQGVSAEVIDLRVLNPFDPTAIVESVRKTGRLLALDGGVPAECRRK
jgi:pyruvate dehydrogenase E1 component beta subunit